jgi:hypothetical protein
MFSEEIPQEMGLTEVVSDKSRSREVFDSVMNFVEVCIVKFLAHSQVFTIKNEPGLTSIFVDTLEHNARKESKSFRFKAEDMEDVNKGNSPRTDFGAKTSNDTISIETQTYHYTQAFCSFEAKILGVNDKQREKEYVIGHTEKEKGVNKYQVCGGIERFKIGKHGSRVYQAGMIGFILKDTFESWLTKINNWISEFAKGQNIPDGCNCRNWSESEKLVEQDLAVPHPRIRKYFSEHSRQVVNMPNKFPITHFWVNLQS